MFYIGCPVWGCKEWVGNFFPPRTPTSEFLKLYSRRLTTVEGNTTFYATPSVETVARWRQEMADTFRFCPKVSRSISHAARLDETKGETLAFTERLRGLGTALGPMFLQLPPSFAPAHLPQLQRFLDFWPSDLRLAVEVRHPGFYTAQHTALLNTLLGQYNAGRVIMDTRPLRMGASEEQEVHTARERKPDLPVQMAITTDFAFVRYIGHPEMEINEPLLDAWAQQLARWFKQGATLYVFCHCPFEVHSPALCAELYRRVQALVPLPPLPWQPAPAITQSQMLFDVPPA